MNTARFLMPIFTLHDFLYLLLDFLLAGSYNKVVGDRIPGNQSGSAPPSLLKL